MWCSYDAIRRANPGEIEHRDRDAPSLGARTGCDDTVLDVARDIAIPVLLLLLSTVSFAEKIYSIGPGIVPPKLEQKQDPVYPPKERNARIEGTVELSLVVGTDQRAHDIMVTKSATPAFDTSAVTAVGKWCFEPGTKNGKPVAVRTKIIVNFRLR
jgi:TonB family protein